MSLYSWTKLKDKIVSHKGIFLISFVAFFLVFSFGVQLLSNPREKIESNENVMQSSSEYMNYNEFIAYYDNRDYSGENNIYSRSPGKIFQGHYRDVISEFKMEGENIYTGMYYNGRPVFKNQAQPVFYFKNNGTAEFSKINGLSCYLTSDTSKLFKREVGLGIVTITGPDGVTIPTYEVMNGNQRVQKLGVCTQNGLYNVNLYFEMKQSNNNWWIFEGKTHYNIVVSYSFYVLQDNYGLNIQDNQVPKGSEVEFEVGKVVADCEEEVFEIKKSPEGILYASDYSAETKTSTYYTKGFRALYPKNAPSAMGLLYSFENGSGKTGTMSAYHGQEFKENGKYTFTLKNGPLTCEKSIVYVDNSSLENWNISNAGIRGLKVEDGKKHIVYEGSAAISFDSPSYLAPREALIEIDGVRYAYEKNSKIENPGKYKIILKNSLREYSYYILILEDEGPKDNYQILSSKRFNNMKTVWWKIFDAESSKTYCFDIFDYNQDSLGESKAFDFAMSLEIKKRQGLVYNGKTYNNESEVVEAMALCAKANIVKEYYVNQDREAKYENYIFEDALFEDMNYLNKDFIFTTEGNWDSYKLQVENLANNAKQEYSYQNGKIVLSLEDGFYQITESDFDGNLTEYLVCVDNTKPEIRALLANGSAFEEVWLEDGKSYTASGFYIIQLFDALDDFTVLRINDTFYLADEVKSDKLFGKSGIYNISAYDRNNNEINCTIVLNERNPKLNFLLDNQTSERSSGEKISCYNFKINVTDQTSVYNKDMFLEIFVNGTQYQIDNLNSVFDNFGEYEVVLRDKFNGTQITQTLEIKERSLNGSLRYNVIGGYGKNLDFASANEFSVYNFLLKFESANILDYADVYVNDVIIEDLNKIFTSENVYNIRISDKYQNKEQSFKVFILNQSVSYSISKNINLKTGASEDAGERLFNFKLNVENAVFDYTKVSVNGEDFNYEKLSKTIFTEIGVYKISIANFYDNTETYFEVVIESSQLQLDISANNEEVKHLELFDNARSVYNFLIKPDANTAVYTEIIGAEANKRYTEFGTYDFAVVNKFNGKTFALTYTILPRNNEVKILYDNDNKLTISKESEINVSRFAIENVSNHLNVLVDNKPLEIGYYSETKTYPVSVTDKYNNTQFAFSVIVAEAKFGFRLLLNDEKGTKLTEPAENTVYKCYQFSLKQILETGDIISVTFGAISYQNVFDGQENGNFYEFGIYNVTVQNPFNLSEKSFQIEIASREISLTLQTNISSGSQTQSIDPNNISVYNFKIESYSSFSTIQNDILGVVSKSGEYEIVLQDKFHKSQKKSFIVNVLEKDISVNLESDKNLIDASGSKTILAENGKEYNVNNFKINKISEYFDEYAVVLYNSKQATDGFSFEPYVFVQILDKFSSNKTEFKVVVNKNQLNAKLALNKNVVTEVSQEFNFNETKQDVLNFQVQSFNDFAFDLKINHENNLTLNDSINTTFGTYEVVFTNKFTLQKQQKTLQINPRSLALTFTDELGVEFASYDQMHKYVRKFTFEKSLNAAVAIVNSDVKQGQNVFEVGIYNFETVDLFSGAKETFKIVISPLFYSSNATNFSVSQQDLTFNFKSLEADITFRIDGRDVDVQGDTINVSRHQDANIHVYIKLVNKYNSNEIIEFYTILQNKSLDQPIPSPEGGASALASITLNFDTLGITLFVIISALILAGASLIVVKVKRR